MKTEKAFFEACFATIPAFSGNEAVIIGDSLTSDMRGGKNAGIKTVWFNRKGRTNTTDMNFDAVTDSLYGLKSIIEKL